MVIRVADTTLVSTRGVILNMLKRNREQTVAELAVGLNVTEMAVRRHLGGLEQEGLIAGVTIRQAIGRPKQKYSLTFKGEEQFPRKYGDLSLGLLQDLEEMSGTDVVNQLFERRKEKLYEQYKGLMKGSFEERVAALAAIQDENGYMVEWEQAEGTITFVERNCPIAVIAKEFPIACVCERKLFEELLDTEHVKRISCIAEDNGDTRCEYIVKRA
ncbi:helix-turn-helix transcriptional regulator [Shouchella shacheensis]|uniref:helix-turn-helix transcriptional regulator n=1 Tax=Shouchella shacheensis TaxID=1649580 RepID=UPI00074042CD|nr:metalloregulator ArsR/SmtB family transcription factor [Shouchella shacheensis]